MLEDGKAASILPGKTGLVAISYDISLDSIIMDQFSFGPNIGSEHFHLAGCQWLLRIGDLNQVNTFNIRISPIPRWSYYSSIDGQGYEYSKTTNYWGMIMVTVGGILGEPTRFHVERQPVDIFLKGNYQLDYDSIINSTKSIVKSQRRWWNDHDFPFYQIIIFPRSGMVGGTCIPNAFICFVKTEVTYRQLHLNLAHEMFHNWLGTKIIISFEKGEKDFKHNWLIEGFTNYFARQLLREGGFMTERELVYYINRDIIDLSENPSKEHSLRELSIMADSGKFSSAQQKIAYLKGALIALKWQEHLSSINPEKTLKCFMQSLLTAKNDNNRLSEEVFFRKALEFNLPAFEDFSTYIIQGKTPELPNSILNNRYVLRDSTIKSFYLGFNLEKSWKSERIEDLDSNSAAFKAGLREGMKLIKTTNAHRFISAWDPEGPTKVTVEVDNIVRDITYIAKGPSMNLKLYAPL